MSESAYTNITHFTSGAIMMAAVTIAMLFYRSWKKTGDQFFLVFSIAFLMLAVERIILVTVSPTAEFQPYGYLIRLSAFGCILWAIIQKNRRS